MDPGDAAGRRILKGGMGRSDVAAAVLTIGNQGQLEMKPAAEVKQLRGKVEKATLKPGETFRLKLTELRREVLVPMGLFAECSYRAAAGAGEKVWEFAIDVAGDAVRCNGTSFPLPSLPWPRPTLDFSWMVR